MTAAGELIFGHHAVQSAVRFAPAQVVEAWVDGARRDQRSRRLRARIEALGCPVQITDRRSLDRLTGGAEHQGVAIRYRGAKPRNEDALEDWLDQAGEAPWLLVLDQIRDPHNLGACLRSAEGAGVGAVVAPRDRAVGLTPAVHKVAAGAAQTMPFFQVTNLARTLRRLGERGVWRIGAADGAEASLYDADFTGALALVLGSEDTGLRRLTREHCDLLVSIPMLGQVSSLNVSVATGVLLYEALRQRSR